MKLEDMKEIVAPPGSVLILQPRADVSPAQYETMCQVASHAREAIGLPVLVIPHGMDAYVLQLPPEEDVTDVTPLVDIAPGEFEQQQLLWDAYHSGSIVDYKLKDGDWTAAHRTHSPIPQSVLNQGPMLRWQPK